MARESKYFSLSLESLRALGSWAADCAERALSVYETHADSDSRPRDAIESIRVFAGGGKRTAQLRSLAWLAYSVAAAAHAASLAAASVYTHPLADVHQTEHILGPAAYAALALELYHAGDPNFGEGEVRWAIEHITSEVREVLLQIPARKTGISRLDKILYELDEGIRSRALLENA